MTSSSARTPSPSRWPFFTAAIGGVALGLGAVVLGAGFVIEGVVTGGGAGFSEAFALVTTALMALGGLLLGVGWIGVAARGEAGFGPALGALAVPVSIGVAIALEGQDAGTIMLRGLIQFVGLTLCAMGFTFGLGDGRLARFGGTRFFAGLGFVGFGGIVWLFAKNIDAPVALVMALCVAGFVGISALGFGIAAGLPSLARDS
ncbi:MAG: hypothetical protein IT385_28015 [Deltaproteobacteria bacterium]|nr:hypothetical protein [Deltaproteobacteria bacterium]